MEEASRRSSGVSLLLQLREASQGVEIRWRDEDTSDAGWTDDPTTDVKGDLPVIDGSWVGIGESQVGIIDGLGRCQ
jgi:hypothetical protein